MGIAVLGPLEVDGQPNGLSPRDRVVLSALVVRAGEPVSTEAMADALWGNALPTSWAKVVQGCVVRLRKRLGSAAIQSAPHGYRLTLNDEELDHRLFEDLLERAREALAGGDAARAAYLAEDALQLWRGPALADVEEWGPGRVETARLDGLRMEAEELLVEAEIEAGRAREVLERGRTLVAQAPFRERRWALLARALHQAGRQPEALGAISRARSRLVEEFGLDPGPELLELESMLLRQDPSLAPAPSPVASAICPYRGLLPYDAADADTFFGREDDVAACLRRLRDVRVLAVVGPSGVGKSSLLRAGVVSALVHSGTPVLLTTPGVHPMDSLVGLKPRGRQTLVVDQAEEAVTLCSDAQERARYVAALAVHVGAGGGLVLSVRADHLGDFAPYPEIARVLEEGMYLLGPMSDTGLRSAIEGPARRAGLRLEAGLVDLLVRDTEGEPAALPLLSHVLRETWERREGPTLTVAGYRATGGIRQAVARSAESVYDATDPGQRGQLRSLLLRLVMPTEDGDAVRTRVPRTKVVVDAAQEALVERLIEARLVSIDDDSVQIAHEALVRVWPRLRGWLDDDVDGLRVLRHLTGAADAWESMGRAESELYRGTRLERAVEWRQRTQPDLSDIETTFLDASVALARTEQRAAERRIARERAAKRRLRVALTGLGAFLVIALVAGVLAVRSVHQAERDRESRAAIARLAEARRAEVQAPTQENVAAGLLLATEAMNVDSSSQARDTLAATLTGAGSLERVNEAGGTTMSMSVSHDGRLLAVGMPTHQTRVFDTESLERVPFKDETPPSSIVGFSPDGRQLAVAVNQWTPDRQAPPRIDDLPLRLYDMPRGTLARQQLGGWREGSSVEYALDYSADGARLATVVQHYQRDTGTFTHHGTATVWDLARPSHPIFRAAVPEYALVALSPDGHRLYSVMKGPRAVREYDVDSGHLVRSARNRVVSEFGVDGFDLSPDGSMLAVGVGNRLLRLDARTLHTRWPALRGPGAGDLAGFSRDGRFLLATTEDRSATIWDAATGALRHRLAVPAGDVMNAGWSPDDTVYTTSGFDVAEDALLMSWHLDSTPGLLTLGEATGRPARSGYQFSLPGPEGRTLARMRSQRLWFVDTATGRETPRSRRLPEVWGARWSPDGRRFLTVGSDQILRVWDARSSRLVAHRHHFSETLPVAISPDGEDVYVPDGTGRLETLETDTLRRTGSVGIGTGVTGLLEHPRNGSVLVTKIDGSVVRVDPHTGVVLARAPAGTLSTELGSVVFSPDGSVLAAADPSGHLRLMDPETLTWLGASSGADWGQDRDFAPDGSQVAAVTHDGVSLWDGHTGAYLATLPLAVDPASVSIAYRRDSTGLVVAAADGRTWVADTRTSTWADRACRIAGRNLTRHEWAEFFPSRPYHATCAQWPTGA